ncbi:radical SAM protein, partial [Salmonella enterica]
MTGRQDIVVSDDQIQVVLNRQNRHRPQQLYRNLKRL